MSAVGPFFGIDIGTRTTAIYCQESGGSSYPVKIYGDEIIPSTILKFPDGSLRFCGDAERAVRDEPQLLPHLIKGFKLGYWVRQGAHEVYRAKEHLSLFISFLWQHLEAAYGRERLGLAWFCFTMPAQRTEYQQEFAALVTEASFPRDRILFLDECSAATLGLAWDGRRDIPGKSSDLWQCVQEVLGRQPGKLTTRQSNDTGLIIDIGAGTTDVAVVALEKDQPVVRATRSTNRAGLDCTAGLALLVQPLGAARRNQTDPVAAWERFVREDPIQADRYKENTFSDHYREEDNRSYPQRQAIGRQDIQLVADDFDAFRQTVAETWGAIRKTADEVWSDANLSGWQPGWVLLVGGGALHSGLVAEIEDYYPRLVHNVKDSRFVTACGAMLHAAQRADARGDRAISLRRGRLVRVIKDFVRICFPEDTQATPVILFQPGDRVELGSELIEKKRTIQLKSNIFSKEGPAMLEAAGVTVQLGIIDIAWKLLRERNDHPATVHATLDPGNLELTVLLLTNNVGLHEKLYGQVRLSLEEPGGFNHVH